jgi:sugar/nucleoside kinase (ribokinase family)
MSQSPFCTIGNISIDDLVFEDGSTMWKVPGGNAVYSALGLAIWQQMPVVIAPVGPEYPFEAVSKRIDMSHCRALDRTLRNWGLYEEGGTRIFTFRTKTKNWLEFSPVPEELAGLAFSYAHLAPLRWELQIEFIQRLRQDGAKLISVDPDDRYLSELQHEPMMQLLDSVDLFLPSKQDADALMPGLTLVDIIKTLRDLVPDLPLIAIKCGENGVLMHEAGQTDYLHVPSIAESVVDTTGAGDAFSGGTLGGYAETGSAVEAVLRGSVSASFAVAAMGSAALLEATEEQALSRLERLRGRIEAHRL